MSIILPSCPAPVSEIIEPPNIAELLMYPTFMVAEADTVWKYGTDFQKFLLSKVPLKYNRKHVTVYSAVHIVCSHMRPITNFNPKGRKHGEEWHIDGFEQFDHDHWQPHESVYLYLAHSSCPTEFMRDEIEITDPNILAMGRKDFCSHINDVDYNIIPQAIENNRIYEFSNHIHRAVMPERPEFRYTFRVRETDRDDILNEEGQMPKGNRYFDIYSQSYKSSITQTDNGVLIDYPKYWLD